VSGSGLSDELCPAIGLTALPRFIGNLDYFCLKGVLAQPSIGSTRIPALLFCIYKFMFCVSPNPPPTVTLAFSLCLINKAKRKVNTLIPVSQANNCVHARYLPLRQERCGVMQQRL
jgi:hypothetical protein